MVWRTTRLGLWLLAVFAALAFAHWPWLACPFYWDELGQFVPAALDIFHSLAWVPYSTVPNVHPPLVMSYLAMIWKVVGFSIVHTRLAMLLMAAGSLVAAWRLARLLSGRAAVAWVAAGLLFASPLFFSQAMMAQLDMPAMLGTTLALLLFLEERYLACALVCCAAVMAKETAIAAPALFGLVLLLRRRVPDALLFLLPLAPLGVWLAVLRNSTGHLFGNPEFTDYNLMYPLHPVRLALALARRGYYLFVGSGHIFGAAAVLAAGWKAFDRRWGVVVAFAGVHVLLISVFGGAVLERYLLPVLPLLYCGFAVALFQVRWGAVLGAALATGLVVACFVNPLYPFPMENNLAWTTFVSLQKRAGEYADEHLGGKVIATSFPMAGALRRPEMGYVSRPVQVLEINDFRAANLTDALRGRAGALAMYTLVWDPAGLLARPAINNLLVRFYGYVPQVDPSGVPGLTGMSPAFHACERGQCVDLFAYR